MLRVRFEFEPIERSRGSLRGLFAAVLTAAALGVIVASVPASGAPGTITACVAKKSGEVRIVSPKAKCKRGERKRVWQKVGPVGAAGSQGPQGPAGATGAQGVPGIDELGDLHGLPCTRGDQQGTVELDFAAGGLTRARCRLPGEGPVCGDGVTEGGEVCDDGNDNPTDGCTNQCQAPACGDSIVQAGESCDQGAATAMCDTNCTAAQCGDGTLNAAAGEVCDTGGESATCDVDCTPAVCGDARVNHGSGEYCDDGNTVSGDGCNATCTGP